MGFPMIQVFMIAARQVSKPVSETIIKYGKDHPAFRNKVLLPVGRGLVHLTTRLRMEKLGLGKPITLKTVSEQAALEQASEFVQQVVIFCYSVGVFAGYYYWSSNYTPETVKKPDFAEFQEQHKAEINQLLTKIEALERKLGVPSAPLTHTEEVPASQPSEPEESRPLWRRITSLPIDTAVRFLFGEQEYLICRRDDKLSIELAHIADARGPLKFRKMRVHEPDLHKGPSRIVYQAAAYITGWAEWEY